VITARGVRVEGVGGPLREGEPLELRLDDESMTFHGGQPPAAWQIPYSALRGTSLRRRGDDLELSGWIAGSFGSITIPLGTLEGGTEEELAELLGRASGVITEHRRRSPVALGLLGVAAVLLVVAGLIALLGHSSSPTGSAAASSSSRAATAERNMVLHDLPSGWAVDSTATSPIGGLLSSGSSGAASASAKASFDAVAAAYESCVGVSHAADRIFGAAGVTPAQQLASSPLGSAGIDSFAEAGSVTQRYTSSADVRRDLAQIRSPRFADCFAEAIGRLMLGGGSTAVAQSLPTTTETLPSSLGVYATGSDVTLSLPSGAGGTVPVDLGVSVLVHGNYEQTLYTFASPTTFDPTLRDQLVSTLAGRLLGAGASAST